MSALATLSVPIAISAGVLLDAALGEPRRWHPLVGFGRMASRVEQRLHAGEQAGPWVLQARGAAAVAIVVAPPVLACVLLDDLPVAGALIEVVTLYLALGHRSLRDHVLRVADALRTCDIAEARIQVGRIVSRETADMDATRVAGAAIESALENGNDAVFGALFWFAVLGAPGALCYRLINTLDAMWGYRTPRYLYFGRAAAKLDDALNFIPARLTAASYALCGSTAAALRAWRAQARAWESPNAGPVMAAGAGALEVQLGGGALYHGHWKHRPVLGEGRAPRESDIRRSLELLLRTLVLWLAAIWLVSAVLFAIQYA